MPTVSFHTLGCRLNQSESASVADDLLRHGYQLVEYGEAADVVVINTCAVTGVASQKSRQMVRMARRRWPCCKLVVIGCDASVDQAAWKGCGIDMVLPHPMGVPLSSLLAGGCGGYREVTPAPIEEEFCIRGCAGGLERTRANLKVQDGCNFYCTYCIVPYSRGPARSREMKDVLREARELVSRGYKELVLCGVNLTTYASHGGDLGDLLEALLSLDGDFRIRLGSSEPGPVIGKVIELMAREKRLCRFLHLPLQYGEDTILERMGRHYSAAAYREICMEAARKVPGICLGADVIVGFPGETDERFELCREYIESIPFGLLHIFPYSVRPGTVAAGFSDKVPNCLATRRAENLMALAEKKVEAFVATQIGGTLQVLVEDDHRGWSDNYLHVHVSAEVPRNSLVNVHVTEALGKREVQ